MLDMSQFSIIGMPTVLSLIILSKPDDERFQSLNFLAGTLFLVSIMAMALHGGGVAMFLIIVAGGMATLHFGAVVKRHQRRVANRLNKSA